jgi:chitodextrinase
MTLSAAQALVMSVIVVKGSNISSPIDTVSLIGSDNGTQTTSGISPPITTSGINDLLIGFTRLAGGAGSFVPGASFTQQPGASSIYFEAEAGPAASAGTYAATFALSAAQNWQSVVVAVSNNPNQSSLSWTPSTETGGTGVISDYLVGSCQGASCSNFAQIGTTTATTFNNTGLTASTSYTYEVAAQDNFGTVGPYASVPFATPAPIPSLPGNLTATPDPSSTQSDLSWTASQELGGTVNGYSVERCTGAGCTTSFVVIGSTSGATTFNDSNVTANTSYTYRVRAQDALTNFGPFSNVATVIPTTP